ncbi:MAG: amidohydrolase family protein [Gemmatimonas sp.]|nr:amidohydrolase family protein [Gemmatimonas sp.]
MPAWIPSDPTGGRRLSSRSSPGRRHGSRLCPAGGRPRDEPWRPGLSTPPERLVHSRELRLRLPFCHAVTDRPTLYRADWLLPVSAPAIARGELLVDRNGRIAAVAPAGALDLPAETDVRDLGSAILLPGLVNVHTHPELATFRGALEDLPFRDWILRLVGIRRAVLRPEDDELSARWTMVEALRAGITTFGATESSGAAAGALAEAGMRGVVYQEVFGPDPLGATAAMKELERAVDRLAEHSTDRVRIGVSPHAPYTVSDDLYRAVAAFARRAGLPIALHIAESEAERRLVVDGSGDFAPGLHARGIATPPRGRSPIEMLSRLGVLDERPLLIHCVDVDERDIETIAAAECPVAHCPIANARLGHGIAPLVQMREAGVQVGLGTDSVGSNNRLDLLEEARIASLLQRAKNRVPDHLPGGELLRLCTIDGARALGMDDRIGSLEPGKEADFCVVAIERPHTVPSPDPLATLFHAARGADVVLTVVGGRVLYDHGEHVSLDVEGLRKGIEEAGERIRSSGR